MEKALDRIKMQLAQMDKENKWAEVDRDEVIDLLIFEEIKAASYQYAYEKVGKMVEFLIKEGEALK
ncbi:hypothetical protein BKP37_08465 [Anaerobacillus alkalilacustris]|uniref:Uncharacterized protein n=1 Tax=Anaerobacillus alkalilacustris TaxID=393763 RepID=A0A1S2LPG4_9BACI|nr:hypothetical protein [Anaerobacillus alkalilacustris]OIJ14371.1 hypothetical protein BKP37_08465 [Anaerobacillus alkalilacustris]